MSFEWNVYRERVLVLRERRQLHSHVMKRLGELLMRAFPDAPPVPEINATPGGRNDLIQFFHDGRRTVFELFATHTQVPQDLRLLEQCQADARTAILVDSEVDSRVSIQFFRKRPNHFPFLWLRTVFEPRWENQAIALLRELTDDNSNIQRIRRLLSSSKGLLVDDALAQVVQRLEERIVADKRASPSARPLNGYHRAALLVIGAIRELGVPVQKLRALYLWLADSIEYAFEIAGCGLHPFLITNLEGQNAIWSVGDVADCVFMAPAENISADILVDLHPIVNRVRSAYGLGQHKLGLTFFHTYAEQIGKIVPAWEMEEENTGHRSIVDTRGTEPDAAPAGPDPQ